MPSALFTWFATFTLTAGALVPAPVRHETAAQAGAPAAQGVAPAGRAVAPAGQAGAPAANAAAPAEVAVEAPSRALLRELTAQPRLAGTTGSRVGAEIVKRHLVAAGWQVEFDEREVLLSYPRSLEFALYPGAAGAPLVERRDRFDADAIPPGDVPKYNAWSASGTVRARVVDAGFGTRADFERLRASGVATEGTIALVRYGKCYRGIKVDLATQFGCAGVLLFSDPASDGAGKGETWPKGPWKADWDAQRGSILGIERVPGDPSTPGYASPAPGATGVKRLAGEQLTDALPHIPCLPIGARDAAVILAQIAPVTVRTQTTVDGVAQFVERVERLGPGPIEARLALDVPRELRTIVNVIARLPGASEKTVIGGAHRDAWVRGANDDGAGTVALLRAAQRLGARARTGWKPKHTLTLAFWDAEEFGMVGSTEWAESRATWLREYAIAYLNADTGVSGPRFQGAGGSPGLLGTLRRALERVPAVKRTDGETPANLWAEWELARAGKGAPELSLPGSGSDFAVFAHHLSLPVLEVGFGGAQGGQYHTTFDDFEFVERWIDPGFAAHECCGELLAELLAEFAERGVLALDPVEAAQTLSARARADATAARETPELARALGQVSNALRILAADFSQPLPRRADLADLGDGPLWEFSPEYRFYRALELPDGLPGRPWFKNPLWAPGLEDGYGSETFPTLRALGATGGDALQAELEAFTARIEAARIVLPR